MQRLSKTHDALNREYAMTILENEVHPGEVIKLLYLEPLEMGPKAIADHLGLPRSKMEQLIDGTSEITPDTALRLARAFDTTAMYWMNLQTNYDLALAARRIDVSGIKPITTSSMP